ncbi:MAG: beta-propeller domain-containing protein, partial [Candidatus Falkowbacteria bacterium]|nr:beta-propeller domain-containing protein [Candidatus Falkowbacteria bacterium]
MPNQKNYKMIVVFLLCLFIVTGCTLTLKKKVPANNTQPSEQNKTETQNANISITAKLAAQSKIKKFASYADLKDFLDNNPTSGYAGGYGAVDTLMSGKAVSSVPMRALSETGVAPSAPSAQEETNIAEPAPLGNLDYSKTNVQVAGVDEADVIKTDGQYIYAVAKNSLFIVNALPADQAEILAKIEFKDRPSDIYISGNYLAVYGNDQEIVYRDFYKSFHRRNSYVFVKIFDITDRKNPKQIRDLDFEGNYSDSRMVGDYLYLITNNYNYSYLPEEPVIPRVIEQGQVLPNECQAGVKCFAPSVYYFDIPYDYYNFTTIIAINIKDTTSPLNGEVYMLATGQNFYVSQNNIYLTYTKYISEYDLMMAVLKDIVLPKLSAKDQERVGKIEQTDDFILNQSEKMAKIGMIIEHYRTSLTDDEQKKLEDELKTKMKQKYQDISKELEKTVIHKIAINQGKIEYQTEGEVTGSVLNQFSMDENDGYFRIATTKNTTWSQFTDTNETQSYNNL